MFFLLSSLGYSPLMASKYRVVHLLMLLFMTWGKSAHCEEFTVDPPEDLTVSDPGRLGYLDIKWNPPSSLINMTECKIQYHLEYFDTYNNEWAALRTSRRSYSAQFDMSKDIAVRVYTMLKGHCTDNRMVMSKNSTELIEKPPSTGIVDTEARDFECVFHNMEWVDCNWARGLKTPKNSQQNLYFWHKPLQQSAECPKYILSGGVRSGCHFQKNLLPEFTDIIFCVNGSSPEGPLKSTFTSLQIQNHLKPTTTDKLELKTSSDGHLLLVWQNPLKQLSDYCLEWEVKHTRVGPDGQKVQRDIQTTETSLTLPSNNSSDSNCFQIRSKLSTTCVEKSLWSDWSRETCHPGSQEAGALPPADAGQEVELRPWTSRWSITTTSEVPAVEESEVPPELKPDLVPVYINIAIVIIVVLVLSMCVWAAIKMKKLQQEKKLGSLLTNLLAKMSALAVAKAKKGNKVCTDAMI